MPTHVRDNFSKGTPWISGPVLKTGARAASLHRRSDSPFNSATTRCINTLTTCELSPELQQRLGTALDKILLMCEIFPVGSDEVYILRNFASILPQLLFAYGTRYPQVRRAVDAFNQGKWKTYGNRPSRQEKEPKTAPPKTHA